MRRIDLRNAKHAEGIDVMMCGECDGIHIVLLEEDALDEAFAQINLDKDEAQRLATTIMGLLGKLQ